METINQEIADECLGNLILNAINTRKKNKKDPDAFTSKNKIENKSTNGKISFYPVLRMTHFHP